MLKKISIILSGTVLAQLAGFICLPIISRLYGYDELAIQSVYLNFINIGSSFAVLGLAPAIVVTRSEEEALLITWATMIFTIIVCVVIFGLLFFLDTRFLNEIGIAPLAEYKAIVIFGVFFSSLSVIANRWIIRSDGARLTAANSIAAALILNGQKITAGIFSPSTFFLLFSNVSTGAISAIASIKWITKKTALSRKIPALHALKSVVKQNRDYILYGFPQGVLTTAAQGLPILFFSSNFELKETAVLGVAFSLFVAPISLLSSVVSYVFLPEISKQRENLELARQSINKATLNLLIFSIPTALIVSFFSPQIVGLLLGGRWSSVAIFAPWLCIYGVSQLVTRPYVSCVPVLGIQRDYLMLEALALLTKYLSLKVSLYENNPISSLAYFVVVSLTFNLISQYLVWKKIKHA